MKSSFTIALNLFVVAVFFSACTKVAEQTAAVPQVPDITLTKIAPDGFTYQTSKTITIQVNALTNDSKPLSQVPVNIYSYEDGAMGALLFQGYTSASGAFTTNLTVPSALDTVIIDPAYLGLVRLAKVLVAGNSVTCTFGGATGQAGDIVGTLSTGGNLSHGMVQSGNVAKMAGYSTSSKTKFVPLGTYNQQGRPDYLETKGDVISAALLASINASLPETKNVAQTHPQYLDAGAASNIVVTEKSDIWLTFVYEGAGFRNVIGFYKYPTSKPPTRLDDIDTVHLIFPNASMSGSGGTMQSGDKVRIGSFEAGTTIGLVLLADGWNGSGVNYYAYGAYFSDSNLNPETDPARRRHTVLLKYEDKYIIGFEDLNRGNSGCDNDFNDVMVYASSNPITAISSAGVQVAAQPVDADGDGVLNANDAFPNDPTRAYVNYFPSANAYASLAYEDQWPNTGDYDLNDLVVNYRYKIISNAQNSIVEFYADYVPTAAGATLLNGFGVQFPFSPSSIKSVTGQRLNSRYIKQNNNGTEAGQSNAVIIPFDNYADLFSNVATANMLNTDPSKPLIAADTAHIYVQFNTPISGASFGNPPFNPFVIKNRSRGYEVHLPGYRPTDLVDKTKLGTIHDGTNTASGIYYVTKDNHPWALSFTGKFIYPIEGINIAEAYPHFREWASSGGRLFSDWYSNTTTGYRNEKKMYKK